MRRPPPAAPRVNSPAGQRHLERAFRADPQHGSAKAGLLQRQAERPADQADPDDGDGFHQRERLTAGAMIRSCRIISSNCAGARDWAPTLSVAVDPATNRIVGQSYDANGNLLYNGAVYDALNRVWQIYQYGSLNTEGYAYGPNNERVEKVITANGTSNYYTYLYGVDGCRLGVYQPAIDGTGRLYFQGSSAITPCFGGRMLYTKAGQLAVVDRLGSIRPLNANQTATTSYYPYGEEQPQQASEDTERFATYYRDSTNLDYAKNRYYTNQFGRFLTPDPSTGVNLGDPRAWNKYTYVGGDPVNYNDPSGAMMAVVCGFQDCGGGTFGPLIGPFDWYFWVGNGGDRAYPDPLGEPKGGGGSFVRVQPKVPAGNSYKPAQMQALTNGLNNALSHTDQVDCATFYAGGDDNPSLAVANVLENTLYRLIALPRRPSWITALRRTRRGCGTDATNSFCHRRHVDSRCSVRRGPRFRRRAAHPSRGRTRDGYSLPCGRCRCGWFQT